MAFAERDDFRENRREARFDMLLLRVSRSATTRRPRASSSSSSSSRKTRAIRQLVRQRFFFVFPRFIVRRGRQEQNPWARRRRRRRRVRVGGERVVKRAEKRPGAQRRRSRGKPRRVLRIVLFAAGTPLHLGERPAPLRSGPGSRGRERIRVLGNGPGEVRAVRVPGDGDVPRPPRPPQRRTTASSRRDIAAVSSCFVFSSHPSSPASRGRAPAGTSSRTFSPRPSSRATRARAGGGASSRARPRARPRDIASHRALRSPALNSEKYRTWRTSACFHRAVRLPRRLLSLQGLARGHAQAERAPRLRFRLCARVPPPGLRRTSDVGVHAMMGDTRGEETVTRQRGARVAAPRCRPRARVSPLEAVACDAPLRARRRATTREQTSPPSLTRAPVVFGSAEPRKTAPECFH